MTPSDTVLNLVRTVGRLPREDQDRILRVVNLISHAPTNVRQNSQRMIRELVSDEPVSRIDCVAELEIIISYLESSLSPTTH